MPRKRKTTVKNGKTLNALSIIVPIKSPITAGITDIIPRLKYFK
jgi:hypothetical protein